ncbi:ABC transporter ATP-binding protein [Costertonia aggregata]|uniref:ATP-binding cassette domain-containing protein n=1 Tax=Costertonia aggregata TaxID=343403 RepID=A0A7H9AN18_9FLAO|nr:ATP-binding cassette domain-containing protein [Costertonia aggregata]QLG44773.1 ATP-binding cassette domain-containing protein [Costertonia aggregata]
MIHCKNLHIQQGGFGLTDINFKIHEGEYAILMGKTGCGKTTILEAICGLRKIQEGEIWLNGHEISKWPPGQREIGYVPQEGALFDHMTVAQNMGFALKIRKWKSSQIGERVSELAALLNLEDLLPRSIPNLSGGEKQRVALGRALSFYPGILCLDEPLSALDEDTKEDMYKLLLSLKKRLKITVLHVSHSRSEAKKLADKILLLSDGKLQIPDMQHK